MIIRTLLILAPTLLLSVPTLHGAEAKAPAGEPRVYKQVEGRNLSLYVVKPEGWKQTDRRPAIVFYHGGGWVGGSPNQFNAHSAYFASRGLVSIQVQYRLLAPKGKIPPVVCIQDARSAMRWVRKHANELGIDATRIAAAGGSAGGHLAAHVGMVEGTDDAADDLNISPKPNAMILFNPVLDNGPGGFGAATIGERYPALSPAHNVSRDDPPAILFLGSEDKLIPVATLEKFQGEMSRAGVRCELRVYDGQGHGFFNFKDGNRYYALTTREADKFLASLGWLTAAPTLPEPAAN
jgi:acetyl esterase